MRLRPTWKTIAAELVVGFIMLIGGLVHYVHGAEGARALAAFVSRSASSPQMRVEIGAIEDALSSSPAVRGIKISDTGGVWLTIDRVEAHWSRPALLALRLDIDRIDIGRVDVLRRPVAAAAASAPDAKKPAEKAQSSWPSGLPLKVRLGDLAIAKIALARPVLDMSATLAADLGFSAGSVKDEADLRLQVQRLDAPGAISALAHFAPRDGALTLKIDASEPEGGVVARLAQIPGLPPVELAIDGAGTLDAFTAKLSAKAGDVGDAEGVAKIAREGAARRVDLDLAARLAAFLPKDLAALFKDSTRLEGVAHLGDDGGVAFDGAALKTSSFVLDVKGKLDAAHNVEARLGLHGVRAAEDAGFSAKTLEGEATVSGALSRPNAALKFVVEDAALPMGRLGRIDLDAKAVADGDLSDPAARLDLEAEGQASGLALSDAALAEALGDAASLSLRARVDGAGQADVGLAKIATSAGAATWSGRIGPTSIAGRAHVEAPDLRRFARLAGRELRGALTFGADLSGAPSEGHVAAKLEGAIGSPGLGVAAVDALLGRRLTLSGMAATQPGGGFAFEKLAVSGDYVSALVDGRATPEKAQIDAKITAPDLSRADARVAGRGEIAAAMTGALQRPDAVLTATLTGAKLNGRSVPKLALRGEAKDLLGALTAVASLDGLIDGRPARGRATAARVGDGWKVDDVDLAIGRASVKGALALDGAGLATGRLKLAAPDLDDLSALALQQLAGRLQADVALDGAGGGQNVVVDATAEGLRAKDASLRRLDAKFTARDFLRRPKLDGTVAIDDAAFGKETVSKARLSAKPAGDGAAALDLSLEARGFNVLGRATLTPGERMRLDVSQFSAQRQGKKIALAAPALVTLQGSGVELRGLSVALGSGRLDVDGTLGERLDLTAKARAVPLSVAAIVDPSLTLEGLVDAEARITGPKTAPAGDWRIKLAKASAPQLRSSGLPAVDAAANGRLSGSRTTLDADIALGSASRVKVGGSAPLGEGALDLTVKGVVDAALANTMLAANGQTVAGKAAVDLRLSGPATAPILGGGVDIANGAFNDPLNGVSLDKITGRIEGRGRDLNIASLSAHTRNGGQIAVSGRVTVAPDAGMPGSLRIGAHNAQLANSDIVSSVGDSRFDDQRTAGARAESRGQSRARLDGCERSRPHSGQSQADSGLDAYRRQGLRRADAGVAEEAAGEGGETFQFRCVARSFHFGAEPHLRARPRHRRGIRRRPEDRRHDPKAGRDGRLRPAPRQAATAHAASRHHPRQAQLHRRPDAATRLRGGNHRVRRHRENRRHRAGGQPTFSFTSTPDLPQDEVLSRLLFAKASGSLSPVQAVQLAAALAQFSGVGDGVGAFEKLRKGLGVDSLDLDAGGANGPTVGASRYIMEGVSVGVKTGAKPEQSAVDVNVDITKKVRVQGETRVDGKSSVGIGVEWEY